METAELLFVLSLVLALSHTVPASTRSSEFYVAPATPDPNCPQEKPCHTLNEYAVHSDEYFGKTNEVLLLFINGDHELSVSNLEISKKNSLSMKPMYVFDIVSITITNSTYNMIFSNITQLYLYGLTITKYGADDICSFQVINVQFFTGQLIAFNLGGLFTDVHSVELFDSLLESWAEVRVQNESLGDESRASLTIDGCTLLHLIVYVQDISQYAVTLKDNTIPLGISIQGNHTVITANKSAVLLNISGCDSSFFSNTAFSVQLENSASFRANFDNTTISHNPIGFYMAAKDSYFNITFSNCYFRSNGDIIHIDQDRQLASRDLLFDNCYILRVLSNETGFISLVNTTIQENRGLSQDFSLIRIKGIVMLVINNCQFVDNSATPVGQNYGPLVLQGSNLFANNSGLRGGALSLVYSQVCLVNNSHTTFRNNSATDVGGAIYIERLDLPVTAQQCFYQVHVPSIHRKAYLNISLTFMDNKAGRGGEDIYGVALNDSCVIESSNGAETSVNTYKQFFNFVQSDNLSSISSAPKRVCLCNPEQGVPECANVDFIDYQYYADQEFYPGEDLKLSVAVVGNEFGTLTSTAYASFPFAKKMVALEPLQTTQNTLYGNCTMLTYTVHSEKDVVSAVLVLSINEAAIDTFPDHKALFNAIASYKSTGIIPQVLLTTPVYVSFHIQDCPLGFELTGNPPSCECNVFLTKQGITKCTVRNHRKDIFRSGTEWVGKYSNNQSNTFVLFSPQCPSLYCKEETVALDLDNPDVQCRDGRAGRLCGACTTNLSQVLGGTECQHCTNEYLALLIVFAVAGVALVCFIKLLDMTVTTGTINGPIFYANIIWVNQNIVWIIDESSTTMGQVLKVFLAWLNLDLGITTCFFDGMTAYWKTWLQYVFPLFIWTIAGAIIAASHYSFKASRLFGNNSIHVLATLFVLSFSKLLQTTITSLSFTYIVHEDGSLVVWTNDGTIDYLSTAHAVLFAVALCSLLFIWAPFILILLFIQPLRRVDHFWPFRWTQKWKPLFDAYTGPLKDKFHYWTGTLLLARAVISITYATTITANPHVSLLVTAIVTVVLCLHTNMYKKLLLSILEKSFLLNICVLTITLLYMDVSEQTAESKAAVVVVSMSIAFIQFVGMVIGHIIWQVKKCRARRNLQDWRPFEQRVIYADGEDYREPLIESANNH